MEPEDSLGDGSDRVYNLRKINEMPFHLLHAQLLTELKSVALLSFEWILAKLCGTTLRGLLEEYSVAIQVKLLSRCSSTFGELRARRTDE